MFSILQKRHQGLGETRDRQSILLSMQLAPTCQVKTLLLNTALIPKKPSFLVSEDLPAFGEEVLGHS